MCRELKIPPGHICVGNSKRFLPEQMCPEEKIDAQRVIFLPNMGTYV